MKYKTEEEKEIKKFIIVLLIVIIAIVIVYFFTRAFVTKDLFKSTDDISYKTGAINDESVIVGTMLSRADEEYYVYAFSNTDNYANYYNTLIGLYTKKEKHTKVYFLDLDNKLNEKYIASNNEEASTKFENIDKLKLGDITLLKIKNGKVTKYLTNDEDIKKELNV